LSLKVIENVRRKPIDRFPVSIYFVITADVIRVVAIAGDKLRPFY